MSKKNEALRWKIISASLKWKIAMMDRLKISGTLAKSLVKMSGNFKIGLATLRNGVSL